MPNATIPPTSNTTHDDAITILRGRSSRYGKRARIIRTTDGDLVLMLDRRWTIAKFARVDDKLFIELAI